jgi:NADPH:quinone reductase-like Zn-dependent oxidoreductase
VYSGLNFAELMMRQGLYKRAGQPPYIPGFECSGTVEVVGDEVQNLEVANSARHNTENFALNDSGSFLHANFFPLDQGIQTLLQLHLIFKFTEL